MQGATRELINVPALVARGLIRAYRYSLSALAGRTCRHLPTCSEYADLAIGRHGLWRGGWLAFARFSRCRPLGSSGFDPVPETLPPDSRWYTPWRYGRWGSRL
jgi:putative membrane protein insertion efficiency factor